MAVIDLGREERRVSERTESPVRPLRVDAGTQKAAAERMAAEWAVKTEQGERAAKRERWVSAAVIVALLLLAVLTVAWVIHTGGNA